MKALPCLIVMLSLMARSTVACPIVAKQANELAPCLQFQFAILKSCQLAGIKTIKNRDFKEAALANLASEYALAGAFDQALDLSDRLQEGQRSKPLSIIVGMMGSSQTQRSPNQTRTLLTRISQSADSLTTPAIKASLVAEIAQALIQLNHKEEALKMLPKLLSTVQSIRNSEEREKQFATVVSLYAKVGKFDQALKLAETLTADQKDETLRDIAQSLAADGQFKSASQIIDRIQASFYKISALEQVALAYVQAAKKPEALTILSQAVQLAEKLDVEQENQERTDLLGDLAVDFVKIGQNEKAFQVIGKIEPASRPSKASELADYYLITKQYDRVMQVIQVMKAAGDRSWVIYTLSNLAEEYITLGQYDQALEIANSLDNRPPFDQQSVGFSNQPEGRSGKLGVLTYLASEYAKKGEKPKATALFDSILDLAKSSATPTELAEIALTYYHALGDRVKAVAILDQALNQVKQKPVGELQGFVLSRIAETYAAVGKVEKALQVVDSLPIDSDIPERSAEEKAQTLVNIASTTYETGAFTEALQILRLIKPEKPDVVTISSRFELLGWTDEKSRLLTQMVYRSITNQQYDRAIQAAQAMDEPADRDRFIQTIQCGRRKQ